MSCSRARPSGRASSRREASASLTLHAAESTRGQASWGEYRGWVPWTGRDSSYPWLVSAHACSSTARHTCTQRVQRGVHGAFAHLRRSSRVVPTCTHVVWKHRVVAGAEHGPSSHGPSQDLARVSGIQPIYNSALMRNFVGHAGFSEQCTLLASMRTASLFAGRYAHKPVLVTFKDPPLAPPVTS